MQLSRIIVLVLVSICYCGVPSKEVTHPIKSQLHPRTMNVKANTTVPVILPIPPALTNVVSLEIKDGQSICEATEVEPQVRMSSTLSIGGITRQISNKRWDVEIMSFAYDRQNSLIYTLLDNGTLLISPFQRHSALQTVSPSKSYSFEAIGDTETWLTSKHKLLFMGKVLFVLESQLLSKIILHEQGYWKKDTNVIKRQVVKAQIIRERLFMLTNEQLITLDQDGNQTFVRGEGKKFVDFCFMGSHIYLLDAERGVIGLNLQDPLAETIHEIPSLENSIKIRGIDKTLLIIYELDHRNFMAEYFIANDTLTLNRYYYNYYSIKDVIMSKTYAIIDGYNEFILFHHSVNRESFESLAPLEEIYKSYGIKVVEIELIDDNRNFSIILAQKSTVQQVTFVSHEFGHMKGDFYSINNLAVKCNSNISNVTTVNVLYKGTCSNKHSPASTHYCEVDNFNLVNFQYSHEKRKDHHMERRFFFGLVFVILAVFTVLLILAVRKRLVKKLSELQRRRNRLNNRKEQHSLNMEQTFNADIPKK